MGYVHEFIDVAAAMRQLEIHIAAFPGHMKELSSEDLLRRPAPDKWSKQEILGHLIDSAINNLKRFTEIQFLPQPYSVISYRQNELVTVNDYQNLSGHPLGCSGSRISTTLLYEMKKRNVKYGLATMCVGVGQGAAIIYESL